MTSSREIDDGKKNVLRRIPSAESMSRALNGLRRPSCCSSDDGDHSPHGHGWNTSKRKQRASRKRRDHNPTLVTRHDTADVDPDIALPMTLYMQMLNRAHEWQFNGGHRLCSGDRPRLVASDTWLSESEESSASLSPLPSDSGVAGEHDRQMSIATGSLYLTLRNDQWSSPRLGLFDKAGRPAEDQPLSSRRLKGPPARHPVSSRVERLDLENTGGLEPEPDVPLGLSSGSSAPRASSPFGSSRSSTPPRGDWNTLSQEAQRIERRSNRRSPSKQSGAEVLPKAGDTPLVRGTRSFAGAARAVIAVNKFRSIGRSVGDGRATTPLLRRSGSNISAASAVSKKSEKSIISLASLGSRGTFASDVSESLPRHAERSKPRMPPNLMRWGQDGLGEEEEEDLSLSRLPRSRTNSPARTPERVNRGVETSTRQSGQSQGSRTPSRSSSKTKPTRPQDIELPPPPPMVLGDNAAAALPGQKRGPVVPLFEGGRTPGGRTPGRPGEHSHYFLDLNIARQQQQQANRAGPRPLSVPPRGDGYGETTPGLDSTGRHSSNMSRP